MQDVSVNLKVPVKTFHCLKSTGATLTELSLKFLKTFCVLVFWPLIHFVFCWGSFRACCILWGVPLVEDGVATYMSIFDQPVNSEMGCSLIDICSISVPPKNIEEAIGKMRWFQHNYQAIFGTTLGRNPRREVKQVSPP
jgi:hypothetical protein